MKIIFLLLFVTIGCTNLRHATNINFKNLKNISHDIKRQKELNKKIKTITPKVAKKCTLIKEISAKDNVIDQGEKFAVLYLKVQAEELDGNAVSVDNVTKNGDYGFLAEGKIYNCPIK